VQLYSRGHVNLLAAELSDLDVFARVLKINDKRFVCRRRRRRSGITSAGRCLYAHI